MTVFKGNLKFNVAGYFSHPKLFVLIKNIFFLLFSQVIFNTGDVQHCWADPPYLRAIRPQLYRVKDDGWSNHKGFPAGKLWFGLFSVGKLGHLGWAITAKAILVHAGPDSKEITAVIYSWHKWVKTQSPPSAPFSPAACWTRHIIFTSPLLYPTILPTWSFSLYFLPTHINHIKLPPLTSISFSLPYMYWICKWKLSDTQSHAQAVSFLSPAFEKLS